MTSNIVQQLKKIEAEQQKRQNYPLFRYNKGKIHQKQMAFHKCSKRNRWVFGGNRSGKTECGAVETVWLALGTHPFRVNKQVDCWVVSLSQQVQRDVAQQKILYYLPKDKIVKIVMQQGSRDSPTDGVIDYILVKNIFGTTSKIGFKSCEAGREKFQGTSLDFVWFDEEPPYDIYQECKMRLIDRCGHMFGTMTPLKGLSWVYDEIYLNKHNSKEVWCQFMEWADNPFLSAEEVQSLTETMPGDELDSRRYGHFTTANGLVYTEFDPSIHVIEPFDVPPDWQDILSIDPGLNNPLSCHWYAQDYDGNVYVVAEHFQAQKDVVYHAQKIKQISKNLGWKTDPHGRIVALIDSAANQHTLNGKSSVAELFTENGILVNTHVNKNLYTGISKVKNLLSQNGKPKLFIFSSCTNLIRELKGYFWSSGDTPIKRDDHALDELRYYACYRTQKTLLPQKTAVQLDKERIIRQAYHRTF